MSDEERINGLQDQDDIDRQDDETDQTGEDSYDEYEDYDCTQDEFIKSVIENYKRIKAKSEQVNSDVEKYSYISEIVKQVEEERAEKYRMLDSMTEEEKMEYYRQKSERVARHAQENGVPVVTADVRSDNSDDSDNN